MKKNILISILLFTFGFVNAQIQVKVCNNTNFSPYYLILSEFLGEGVEVLDIKYDGKDYSVGQFKNIGDVIGIDRGIIMTTGEASKASLPNTPMNHTSESSGFDYYDIDLQKAAETSDSLLDICRYEIKFRPFSDSISFNYVFASEEYPQYSCEEYNDVFGFFISGPNPNGGIYDFQNIALIPGTDSSVSIHNIHPEYNPNSLSISPCLPEHGEYYHKLKPSFNHKMTYNGFLDVFVASAKVIPCEVYTIKIAIADVKDETHDSAVFLKAKSFSTNVLKTELQISNNDSTIAEGCGDAILKFYFNNPVQIDYDLDFRILNTLSTQQIATINTDYISNINNLKKIPKGKNSVSISFKAIEDNIDEGEEIIAIEYQKDFCNKDTLILKIVDNELSNIILLDSISVCEGDTINMGAKLSNNNSFLKDKYFKNSNEVLIPGNKNSSIISFINVNNVSPNEIYLWKIKEICIDTLISTVLTDLDIVLYTPGNVIPLELSTDNGFKNNDTEDVDSLINTCFTPNATIPINNGNYTQGDFDPLNPTYTGNFKPEGYFSDIEGKPVNGQWKLQVTNDEQGFTSILKSWHITFKSNYTIDYKWTPNYNISCDDCLSPDIYPKKDTLYKILMSDSYGCEFKDSIKASMIYDKDIPYVDCDSISTDFIRVKWGNNSFGDIFEIRVNNGSWIDVNTNTYSLSGLGFSETVKIEVRIKSNECTNSSIIHECTTYACPAPNISTISNIGNKCFDDNKGEISIIASGTKPPYTYLHNGTSNNTGIFRDLSTGTDTIFITDGDTCSIPYIFTINSPEKIETDFSIEKIKCYNDKNGSIKTNASGGFGNLNYKWKNNSSGITYNTESLSNLGEGTYTLTITDENNCEITDSVTLNNPSLIVVKDSLTNIYCKGENTGKIFLTPNGGTKPYKYNWNTPIGNSTLKDLSNIPAGDYFITVTDFNGCEVNNTYLITEPLNGLEVEYSITDSLCFGENTGSIELNLPPGNNYKIIWSNDSTGISYDNLQAGHYEITITDESIGCQKIISDDIVQLDQLTISLDQTAASCHGYEDGQAHISSICYGTRETNITGFNFKWQTSPPQTGLSAFDLKGGSTYSVLATNNFGCSAKGSITIGNPNKIKIKTKVKKDISCFGLNDGFIEVENHGGNNSFTYKWSSKAGVNNQSFADSLYSGIYKLTVTDDKGCKEETSFYIKEPEPIVINFDNKPVNCYKGTDGSSTPIVKGGIEPYIILWENHNTNNVLKNVTAGKYFIKIKDLNGCEKVDSTVIKEPKDSVFSVIETVDLSCFNGFDGKLNFNTIGGTPPYSNKVLGGKFYSGSEVIGLESGKYTAITKDVNGCTDTIKNIVISSPQEIIVDLGNDTIVDYSTTLKITPHILNAQPPLNYSWVLPQGINSSCNNCNTNDLTIIYNTLVRLQVIDSFKCIGNGQKNISVNLNKSIFIPDAFRPSSLQESNKRLYVYGKNGIQVLAFKVFDSWGSKVYEKNNFIVNDETEGWDGSFNGIPLNPGSFIWQLKVKSLDGTIQNYKGVVALLK